MSNVRKILFGLLFIALLAVLSSFTDSFLTASADSAIMESDFDIIVDFKEYDGTPQTITITSPAGLILDEDYTVRYLDNVNAGTALAIIEGVGNNFGNIYKEFTINPKPLTEMDFSSIEDINYNSAAQEPEILSPSGLIKDKDYSVSFLNNVNASLNQASAVIEGKGNYTGEVTLKFNVLPRVIAAADFICAVGVEYNFGQPVEAAVFSPIGLVEGVDYTLFYFNNNEIGAGAVYVDGIDNCLGRIKLNYEVIPISLKDSDFSDVSVSFTYSGEAFEPDVVSLTGLIKGIDYIVSYYGNVNAGEASIILQGIGIYRNQILKSFTINRVKTTKPTSKNFVYDGMVKTGIYYDTNESIYTVEGICMATDAGRYSMRFTLNMNYMWEDGSTNSLLLEWQITAKPTASFLWLVILLAVLFLLENIYVFLIRIRKSYKTKNQ